MVLWFLTAMAWANSGDVLPHMDLDMTGEEYRSLMDTREGFLEETVSRNQLQKVLDLGKRNLDWLQFINQHRVGAKLSFSSKETQVGTPITDPKRSSPKIILAKYDTLKFQIPPAMEKVLYENAPFTEMPPVSDAEYISNGLLVDRAYQSASRWILQEPSLVSYAIAKSGDIRGYYFLSRESNLEQKLKDWPNLPATERSRLTPWLINLCFNTLRNESRCDSELRSNRDALNFYLTYVERSRKTYEGYFELRNPRREAVWSGAQPNLFVLPFSDPGRADVAQFLKSNIEDEWHFGTWSLQLRLSPPQSAFARVEFSPGVTPHVNGLGGNVITMDANQPLTEYNVQWTIRHEFGHVLGLPDCYIEFYDDRAQEMIQYQIDTDNLMCSRRGHLQQTHYDQLRKNYFHALH